MGRGKCDKTMFFLRPLECAPHLCSPRWKRSLAERASEPRSSFSSSRSGGSVTGNQSQGYGRVDDTPFLLPLGLSHSHKCLSTSRTEKNIRGYNTMAFSCFVKRSLLFPLQYSYRKSEVSEKKKIACCDRGIPFIYFFGPFWFSE